MLSSFVLAVALTGQADATEVLAPAPVPVQQSVQKHTQKQQQKPMFDPAQKETRRKSTQQQVVSCARDCRVCGGIFACRKIKEYDPSNCSSDYCGTGPLRRVARTVGRLFGRRRY